MGTVQQWSGREARSLRVALRMSVRTFAAYLGVNERTVTKWEAGGTAICPRPEMQSALDTALAQADNETQARFHQSHTDPGADQATGSALDLAGISPAPRAVLSRVEQLRRSLSDTISESAVSAAGVDDWERTAAEYGYVPVTAPPSCSWLT